MMLTSTSPFSKLQFEFESWSYFIVWLDTRWGTVALINCLSVQVLRPICIYVIIEYEDIHCYATETETTLHFVKRKSQAQNYLCSL